MTSKYEDALNNLIRNAGYYGYAHAQSDAETIREALRKAESMDRLIEEIDKGFFFTVAINDKLVEINPVF